MLTYEKAIESIAALEPRGWKLGLERMTEFISRLNLELEVCPPKRNFIHVAGTNGKGSTTTFVQNLLLASGHSCGGFYSPYVFDPRERVQLNGRLIPKNVFASLTENLLAVMKQMDGTEFGGVTEFELKTALGFLYWASNGTPWVALETGLGGRLDSTNVVDSRVSIIVSIGLDHQQILGHTLKEIAIEKAGIIKPGRPIMIGDLPEVAEKAIVEIADQRGSKLYRLNHEILIKDNRDFITPWGQILDFPTPKLAGIWQRNNLALAVSSVLSCGVELTSDIVDLVAEKTKVPGRFQVIEKEGIIYILDGAHNTDSARSLSRTLATSEFSGKKPILMTNMVQGHDPYDFYKEICGSCKQAIICPIQNVRGRSPDEVALVLDALNMKNKVVGNITEGLFEAAKMASENGTYVLVTGSFYLIGEIGVALGVEFEPSPFAID